MAEMAGICVASLWLGWLLAVVKGEVAEIHLAGSYHLEPPPSSCQNTLNVQALNAAVPPFCSYSHKHIPRVKADLYERDFAATRVDGYLCVVVQTTIYNTEYFFGAKITSKKIDYVMTSYSTCMSMVRKKSAYSGENLVNTDGRVWSYSQQKSAGWQWPSTTKTVSFTTIINRGYVTRDLISGRLSSDLGVVIECVFHARLCKSTNGVIVWDSSLLTANPWKKSKSVSCFHLSNHYLCDNDIAIPAVEYKDMYLNSSFLGIGKFVIHIKNSKSYPETLKLADHLDDPRAKLIHKLSKEPVDLDVPDANISTHKTVAANIVQVYHDKYLLPALLHLLPTIDRSFLDLGKLVKILASLLCKQYTFSHRLLFLLSIDNPRVVSSLSESEQTISIASGDLLAVKRCSPVNYTVVCSPKAIAKDGFCPDWLLVNTSMGLKSVEPITHVLKTVRYVKCDAVSKKYYSLGKGKFFSN